MARDPRRSGWGIQPESGEFYDAQGASQVALPLNNAPNTTLWGERWAVPEVYPAGNLAFAGAMACYPYRL